MEELNKGDIVMLKSGGPKMTVQGKISELNKGLQHALVTRKGYNINFVICQWFDGNEKKEDYFAPETLKKAD